MRKLRAIVALVLTVILFANCKPKPSDSEIIKANSTLIEKPVAIAKSEEPNLIYFKAVGTEPFWGIEFSNDSIKFMFPEKDLNFSIASVEPKKAMDANVISYSVQSDTLKFDLTIQQEKCSDGMSDKTFNYSVKGSLQRGSGSTIVLNGCGNYVVDYRLHDIWALEELEGKKINAEEFKKGVPNLEIFAEEARFSGMGGCNRIGGKLFSERNLLRFTDVFSTEMLCENSNIEEVLLKALRSTTRYELKSNKLYLFNQEGTKAIFKKVD